MGIPSFRFLEGPGPDIEDVLDRPPMNQRHLLALVSNIYWDILIVQTHRDQLLNGAC